MLLSLDFSILFWIQEHLVSPVLTVIMRVITHLGDYGIIWILLAAILLLFKKTRGMGVAIFLSIAIGGLIGNVFLKNIVARLRPFQTHAFELLIPAPTGYSFPSGHTLASFAAASAILYFDKKWGIVALIGAALIGFSRLYFFVHFPTDVLMGVLLGIVSGYLGYRLSIPLYDRLQKKTNL